MSLTFLNTAMIEQPASINQLSANNLQAVSLTSVVANIVNLNATSLTANNIQIGTITGVQSINGNLNVSGDVYTLSGNSTQWNQVFSYVQANSASWEESDIILPTITNYLSTNNVLISSLNVNGTILSGGADLVNIFTRNTNITPLTSNWQNTYLTFNSVSAEYSSVATVVENVSAFWNNSTTTFTQVSNTILNNSTTLASNSSNWQDTYFNFNLVNIPYADQYTTVTQNSANWGLGGDSYTVVSQSSSNWNNTYTSFSNSSGNYDSLLTVVALNSASWEESGDTLPTVLNYLSTNNVIISSLQGINNNLNIVGDLTVTGTISTLSALQITQTTFLTGYTTLLSSLEVEGDIVTTNGRFVSGSIDVKDIFLQNSVYAALTSNWETYINIVDVNYINWNSAAAGFLPIQEPLTKLATIDVLSGDNSVYIETNGTSDAFKVYQTGNGNTAVFENNGTHSPFIINSIGQIVAGHTGTVITGDYTGGSTTPKVGILGRNLGSSSLGLYSYSNLNFGAPNLIFSRATSNSIGVNGPVTQNSILGGISWAGDEGENFSTAACILGIVDGDVTPNSVPGGISIRTISVSSTTLNERLYINSSGEIDIRTTSPVTITSAGNIGIGTTNPNHALTVVGNISATGIVVSANTLTTSVCAMSGNGLAPFVMQFTNGLLTGITF